MMVDSPPGGRTRNEWGSPKRAVQRRRVLLFLWEEKQAFAPPSFPTNPNPYQPQGACRSRANVSRLGGTASLEAIPIGRDKAKSRWFSKSKSICAGGSGKVPRLCAIWTPQCGGMKGKLCFIKRKSKNLVSNDRIFCEKNVSFFLSIGRDQIKTCGLSYETPLLFSSSSPFFGGNDARFFPPPPFAVSSSAASYARTDTPLRIAHSASSQFLPSPFTFTRNLLIPCVLQVKDCAFFCLHR